MMLLELSIISLCSVLSLLVVWTRSPFMSLMYAVMLFINASIVLLMLGFEFLALVNLLVYVGALAVLFLFVIMIIEIPATELRSYARGLGSLAVASVLVVILLSQVISTKNVAYTFVPALESISSLGQSLYIYYADILILNSMVLTIALFGALALANTRS